MHSCADPFLMLEEGALVSFPICPQKHSGPFLASTLLLLLSSPPSPPPPLHSLQLANSLVSSIASLQAVQSEYTEKIFHPGASVEFYPAMPLQHSTALHCMMQWDPLEGREGSSSHQNEPKGGSRGLPPSLGPGRPLWPGEEDRASSHQRRQTGRRDM